MNIRGNPQATWDDIDCKHLNEDKTCELASSLAGTPALTRPYACSICTSWENGQTITCRTVHRLAKEAKKAQNEELYLTIEQRLGVGVGTELHKLIPDFLEREGCNCRSFAKKMNIWGPDSCEQNRQHIINHIVHESKQRAILSWVPDSATIMVANKLLTTAITKARKQEPDPNNKWFCALTTAPRKVSTLKTCVESLQVAGFEPFIFAEPDSTPLGKELEPFMIRNAEKRGVWYNWLSSIEYALENSDANIIMTVQDDSLFHPDCKTFLEDHVLWPDKMVGFVSLYTPKHYSKKPNKKTMMRPFGVNRIITRSMWGACALVWPRKILEATIAHPTCTKWMGAPTRTKTYWEKVLSKRRAEPWRVQNSDTAIGKLMNHQDRTMWFCDPSPVQHFASTSAINHGGNKGRRNCGRCAEWNKTLTEQIPLQTNGHPLHRFTYDEIVMSLDEVHKEDAEKKREQFHAEISSSSHTTLGG